MNRTALVVFASLFAVAACAEERPHAVETQPVTAAPTSRPSTTTPHADAGTDAEANPIVDEDAGADAGVCLDDVATFTEACPTTGACAASCAHVAQLYRAGTASYVADCIAKRGKELFAPKCDVLTVMGCIDLAAAATCMTDDAESFCSSFVKRCDPNAGGDTSPISQSGCVTYAKALSPAGRTAFKDCIEDRISDGTCKTSGAVDCADLIRQ